jgi:hypothetical protein
MFSFQQLILPLLLNFTFLKKITKVSLVDEELNCIAYNQQGFNAFGMNDYTIAPTDCLDIVSNCCYARIKLNYGQIPVDNSYCFLLNANKEKFFKRVIDKYTDEMRWFSQQTYGMYQQYQNLGNNLNYTYWMNHTCYEQPKAEDFSSYAVEQCALYDEKGNCTISNDQDGFDTFVKSVYNMATSSVCNTVNSDGSCIDPYTPKYQNNDSLIPLLELMKKGLSVDGSNSTSTVTQDNNTKNKKWPNDCQPIPAVEIQLQCPDTFVSGRYISANLGMLVLAIIFIFI